MTYRLAVVGGGNMGAALVGGLLAGGWAASDVVIAEVSTERCGVLRDMFPDVAVVSSLEGVRCRSALIAVKPYGVPSATAAAVAAGAERVLSIAAGVTLATLQESAGDAVVVRAMPNTPALVGEGAAAVCGGVTATEADLVWAEEVLGAVGLVVRVPESQIDAVTGLAGSGPAYLFLVAEALVDAGVLAGLARPTAESLVTQLLVGSAAMLRERGDAVGLRAMVTSPGGTTAAGLRALEDRSVRSAFIEAVVAATNRSAELGRE